MSIVFTKAEISRMKEGIPKGVEVRLNVDAMDPVDNNSLTMGFTYLVTYLPEMALVRVAGKANCRDSPENIKRALMEFRKNKALPADLGATALNMINTNTAVNVIFFIRPFGLMPPFVPPPIIPAAAITAAASPPAKPAVKSKGR